MSRAFAVLGAILTGVALCLTACTGGGHARHGHVTSKTYEAGHTTWSTVTTTRLRCTTSSRTSRTCSRIPVAVRRIAHHTPACWALHLDTGAHLCVTATAWRHTRVGARY